MTHSVKRGTVVSRSVANGLSVRVVVVLGVWGATLTRGRLWVVLFVLRGRLRSETECLLDLEMNKSDELKNYSFFITRIIFL